MADLTGQTFNSTYKDLLQVSNSNSGVDITLRAISDGEGTVSALSISTDAASVDNIKFDGNTISITNSNGDINLQPNGTGVVYVLGTSSTSGEIRLTEDTDNGTNYIAVKAPASIASNVTLTLPTTTGTLALQGEFSPLSADLDTNGYNIIFDNATGIEDDSGNELVVFTKTATAVNEINIANAATGSSPVISMTGSDSTIPAVIQGKAAGLSVKSSSYASTAYIKLHSSDTNGLTISPTTGANGSLVIGPVPAQGKIYRGIGSNTIRTSSAAVANYNYLINPSFAIAQRGTTFNSSSTFTTADDTYLFDRWNFLQNGAAADFTVTRDASVIFNTVNSSSTVASSDSSPMYSMKFTVNTEDKQCAVVQILDAETTKLFKGAATSQGACFRVKLRGSASNSTLSSVGVALIAWTSTADTVTSDVITTWNGAGTAPTLATNWSYVASPTGSIALKSNTWAVVDGGINTTLSTVNNLALLIYMDSVDATVNDVFYICQPQLEVGFAATDYQDRPISEELRLCQRFFCKSFAQGTTPAQNVGAASGEERFTATVAGANTNRSGTIRFPSVMRTTPTITLYSPAAASAQVYDHTAAGVCTSAATANISDRGFAVTCTGNASTAVGGSLGVHFVADAEL